MMSSEIINQMNYAEVMGLKIREQHKNTLSNQIKTLFSQNRKEELVYCKQYKESIFLERLQAMPSEFRTFNGYIPKTPIFYSNYCELELLRIYYSLNNGMGDLEAIYHKTKARVITTDYDCLPQQREGLETSIVALRYVSRVFSEEDEWIDLTIKKIIKIVLGKDKAVSPQSKLYFLQALNEINGAATQSAIESLTDTINDLAIAVGQTNVAYRDINETILSNTMGTLTTDTCIIA